MYFSDITNKQLQYFHKKTKLGASYSELHDMDTDLFDTSQSNKCIPLFYFDTISGNENVIILDNLIVLYSQSNDLNSVYFNSEGDAILFGVTHEIVTVNSKYYLKLHFYDAISLSDLNNFRFNIMQSSNGINRNYATDKYGNCIIPLTSNTGTFTVISNDTNQTISWSETS